MVTIKKGVMPPIKYFGGKNGMKKVIYEYFPPNDSYDTYIEPFGGSYGVGIGMENLPKVEIYNDLNKNVYSLYKVINDNDLFEKFREKCEKTYYSEDLRNEYRLKLQEDLDIVDRAFMYFYVNRTSRNGNGGLSVNRSVRRGTSKSTSDFLSAVERLPELHDRLSRVVVLNRDAIGLIKKYNDENCFLYCDPPYDWSTRSNVRYETDMNEEQQDEFLKAVIDSKAKILISGYDCERYKILEENGFTKEKFSVSVMSGDNNTPKEKEETLWFNYGR